IFFYNASILQSLVVAYSKSNKFIATMSTAVFKLLPRKKRFQRTTLAAVLSDLINFLWFLNWQSINGDNIFFELRVGCTIYSFWSKEYFFSFSTIYYFSLGHMFLWAIQICCTMLNMESFLFHVYLIVVKILAWLYVCLEPRAACFSIPIVKVNKSTTKLFPKLICTTSKSGLYASIIFYYNIFLSFLLLGFKIHGMLMSDFFAMAGMPGQER
ncbi:hypothetical protein ACJX0J_034290, partial [Zea mays]